jgi:ketosteroid isomerase-like protein
VNQGPHATGRFVSAGRGYLRAMTKAHARADSFATALRSFEDTGDSSQLRELFAPNPELLRPQVATGNEGTSDVTRFWEEYRSQFSQLSTEFVRVMESGDLGVLEWVSRGTLTTGRPIEYSGTSLLNFDDEGRIRRFATYFDTAAFLRSQPSER